MTKLPPTLRERALEAVTAHDAESPFVSQTQLVDALVFILGEFHAALGQKPTKEWARIAELSRRYAISPYTVRQVIERGSVPFLKQKGGARVFSVLEFEKAYKALAV